MEKVIKNGSQDNNASLSTLWQDQEDDNSGVQNVSLAQSLLCAKALTSEHRGVVPVARPVGYDQAISNLKNVLHSCCYLNSAAYRSKELTFKVPWLEVWASLDSQISAFF